ncbi:hypothetical protein [Deinococcus sedimenti]|uniref:hypothetical protein n=1 Tax=Deinococcus sedimenti TaxID=1867090 RepID=UPI001668FF61|nr:hypothetical protein [Deinococcus sedimenti]
MMHSHTLILEVMLALHAAGEVPFRASDVYRVLQQRGAPYKEKSIRTSVYGQTLTLKGGEVIALERTGRGTYQVADPDTARAALQAAQQSG